MSLTRKHFKQAALIVQAVADETESADGLTALKKVAEELADWFAGENGLFDRGRFEDACGLDARYQELSKAHKV